MCLVAIAWRAHPRFPVIIAGNRDEFHERPSAAASWWAGAPQVLGGRDLVAGGSWLAINRNGRFAVVLNNPQRPPGAAMRASRGRLVSDYVTGEKPSGRFMDAVQVAEQRYAGFYLMAGTPVQIRCFASPGGAHRARWTLVPGVTAISNAPLEAPSPKVGYLREALTGLLAGGEPDAEEIFSLLARREPVATGDRPEHPAAHTPFVVGARYGTRASTVITIDDTGLCRFEERSFDAAGECSVAVRESFPLDSA